MRTRFAASLGRVIRQTALRPMESLLLFAEELERRDGEAAQALLGVERLQAEVEELRAHGVAVATFFAALPAALEERDADERAAEAERTRAAAVLRDAEAEAERARKENERLAAERLLQEARDEVRAADAWAAQAQAARETLARESDERHLEAEQVASRATALAGSVRDVPAPAPGIEGALEWASRARGALLLEHAGLVTELDTVVREASELLASVLGDPLTAIAVAGLRDRLERALR